MSNISLDTEGERWMWGGIIGGSSVVFVAISLAIRRIRKRYLRNRDVKRVIQNLYSEGDNKTVFRIDGYGGGEADKISPSAPPYDQQI